MIVEIAADVLEPPAADQQLVWAVAATEVDNPASSAGDRLVVQQGGDAAAEPDERVALMVPPGRVVPSGARQA